MSNVDLTQLFDPAKQWPNAETCPDWPINLGNPMGHQPPGSVALAEQKLEYLSGLLNKGAATRKPNATDISQIKKQYFAVGNHGPHWLALGFTGLTVKPGTRQEAELIVEAAHIRGYLRKLKLRQDRAVQLTGDEVKRYNRGIVDTYKRQSVIAKKELEQLSAAEERHKQRIADEQAFKRANYLRQHLTHLRSEAGMAANRLGEELNEAEEG